MTRERKSPQVKKQLEYSSDHFTFSNAPHAFRKSWKRKKANTNREYRRKSDELLVQAKPEMSADDAEAIVGDLTIGRLKRSITRERLRKHSIVSLGEKVQIKLEKRKGLAGRRVDKRRNEDEVVTEAVTTLASLNGEDLLKFLRRAVKFLEGGDPIEWARVSQSGDRLDRALGFLEALERGGHYREALCADRQLREAFQQWRQKANRILRKEAIPGLRKAEEKRTLKGKLNSLRRSSAS